MSICGAKSPSHGPYGSVWLCHELGWHARHRYRNYTWGRVPHVWRIRSLWGTWRTNRRLVSYQQPGDPKPGLLRYDGVLFPRRFDPLPNDQLAVRMAREAR